MLLQMSRTELLQQYPDFRLAYASLSSQERDAFDNAYDKAHRSAQSRSCSGVDPPVVSAGARDAQRNAVLQTLARCRSNGLFDRVQHEPQHPDTRNDTMPIVASTTPPRQRLTHSEEMASEIDRRFDTPLRDAYERHPALFEELVKDEAVGTLFTQWWVSFDDTTSIRTCLLSASPASAGHHEDWSTMKSASSVCGNTEVPLVLCARCVSA